MLSFIKPRAKKTQIPRIYTDAEIATVRKALDHSEDGDEKAADKALAAEGLTGDDVYPAIKQAQDAADAHSFEVADAHEGGPAALEGQPAPDVNELTVAVPARYGDSVEERAKLTAVVWRKFGEGWQVESFDPSGPSVFIVRGRRPSMRPGAEVYSAGPSATVGNGEAVAASHAAHGRTMLGYDPYTKRVETAVLPPATIELRNRILRKNPKQKSWELELVPIFGVRDGVGHLAKVIIARADTVSPERSKEHAHWLGLAKTVIGHNGWWVRIDDTTGVITMNAGIPLQVPARAPYDYDVIKSGKWGELVVGRDGYNKPVVVDLAATPHALVVGRTGSGKSIFIQTMIFSGLAHGFELAVIDPVKEGLDYRLFQPYTRAGGWGCQSFPEALAAIEGVYAEAKRRKAILSELAAPNWTKLSKEDQIKHGFKPILVIIDEGTSLAKLATIPRSLDKDDPRAVEIADRNSAKELIVMHAANILRECRFVGIHVIFGTQRFGREEIGPGAGEMRENMGARIVLGRTSTSSLSMAFADHQDAMEAYEVAHGTATAEDNDPSLKGREATPGRGLAEIDGRGHVALQGAFAPVEELVARLEEMGIPSYPGDRRPVVPKREAQFGEMEPEQTYHRPPATPKVIDHELDLSGMKLDDDEDPAPERVVPELDWSDSFGTQAPVAGGGHGALQEDDDDPFSGEPTPRPKVVVPVDDDDPFAEPGAVKVKPKPKVEEFEW